MTNFASRIAGIATLALAAVPLAALSTAAYAQPTVRIADLNLASAAGKATFHHRLNVAADQICGREKGLSIQHACKAGVRAEVTEKLAMIAPATELAVR